MKRSIDSIKENEVVWCKSSVEAERLCQKLDSVDIKLKDGSSFHKIYTRYPGELCYNICNRSFGDREVYREMNMTITPATEFIEDQDAPVENKIKCWSEEKFEDSLRRYYERRPDEKPAPVQVKSVPYQLCPMCNGARNVCWNEAVVKCHICKGEGIIAQKVIE